VMAESFERIHRSSSFMDIRPGHAVFGNRGVAVGESGASPGEVVGQARLVPGVDQI
jgi:hypothetical protein